MSSVNGEWLRLSLRVACTAVAAMFPSEKLLAQAAGHIEMTQSHHELGPGHRIAYPQPIMTREAGPQSQQITHGDAGTRLGVPEPKLR